MTTLSISVLVPTFNRGHFLAACLHSLLNQTRRPQQLLVIDDGATDHTAEVLKGFAGVVELMRTPQVGKPAALNAGFERVSSDCVWIFDDDDVALPDALERFIEPLEADPGAGFSFSRFWFTRSRRNGSLGRPFAISHLPDLEARGPLVPLLEGNYLGGAALFARMRCYREVGAFDPALIRSQDYEMAIRMVRRFRGVLIHGGPTFHYRQHAGLRGRSSGRFSECQRNETWLAYGQMFFRRLYHELPLSDYLRPGTWCAELERTALLERCAVMATKDLVAEVLTDLSLLASGSDQSPLTAQEIRIVTNTLLKQSWNGRGILAAPPFDSALRQLALHSEVVREIAFLARGALWKDALRTALAGFREATGGRFRPLANRVADLGNLAMLATRLRLMPRPTCRAYEVSPG